MKFESNIFAKIIALSKKFHSKKLNKPIRIHQVPSATASFVPPPTSLKQIYTTNSKTASQFSL
jgi:hypothetical protein